MWFRSDLRLVDNPALLSFRTPPTPGSSRFLCSTPRCGVLPARAEVLGDVHGGGLRGPGDRDNLFDGIAAT